MRLLPCSRNRSKAGKHRMAPIWGAPAKSQRCEGFGLGRAGYDGRLHVRLIRRNVFGQRG